MVRQAVSGPPRPRCRIHKRNDCDHCRGQSKLNTGEEFHAAYFGDGEYRPTSYRAAGRLEGKGVPK